MVVKYSPFYKPTEKQKIT